jgi:hypothetical protein
VAKALAPTDYVKYLNRSEWVICPSPWTSRLAADVVVVGGNKSGNITSPL